jgi:hypothetical protein
MKTMKWSRGLFRLWLFLSAIWICVMLFIVEPHKAYFRMSEAQEALTSNDGLVSKDEFLQGAANAEAADDEAASQRLRIMAEGLVDGALYETDSYVKLEQAKSALTNATFVTFAPVGVLFLLGAGFLWVCRGFRNYSPSS